MELKKFKIIYEDEFLVAASKPSGLLVHRSNESRDEIFFLQLLRDQLGGDWLYPVHRPDRPASGVMVFGKSSEDARLLSMAIRTVTEDPEEDPDKPVQPGAIKKYLALVKGKCPENFEVNRLLKKLGPKSKKEGQTSHTSFERVLTFNNGKIDLSLVRAFLHTGRRHQIRRHLAGCTHFIIGDSNYGKGRINRFMRENHGLNRLCLHASSLELTHPVTERRLILKDGIPKNLHDFLFHLPGFPRDRLADI